jgi:hypothetical protein
MFNNGTLKEKTFSVCPESFPNILDNSQSDNYIFTWNDGEKEVFVIVPYTGAIALCEHFTFIDYDCAGCILPEVVF